ncbi:MAG: hypothetical protein L0H73_04060 [Nitrococcus sp.]|nr:hypothetical protein [Nitrococcus sp.]
MPVAERRRQAAKQIAAMKKSGRDIAPVDITGRKIALTFWGEAWCKNLEAYSDYANRLPRGRSYVRHGSVLDLQIEAGRVRTLVSGSDLYTVDIAIKSLPKKRWTEIKGRCAGQIDSLIELLKGSISKSVMEIVTRKGEGLFPSPAEITLNCSCPDWATMCKHVAASLYGVGARLDHRPELLFTLRGVDPSEMVEAAVDSPARQAKAGKGRVLETDELSSVFGVDIDMDGVPADQASTSIKPKGPVRRAPKALIPTTSRAGRKTAKKRPTGNTTAVTRTARQSAAMIKNAATKRATSEATAALETAPKKTTKQSTSARKGRVRKPGATTSSAKKSAAAKTQKSIAKQPTAKETTAKSKPGTTKEPRQAKR